MKRLTIIFACLSITATALAQQAPSSQTNPYSISQCIADTASDFTEKTMVVSTASAAALTAKAPNKILAGVVTGFAALAVDFLAFGAGVAEGALACNGLAANVHNMICTKGATLDECSPSSVIVTSGTDNRRLLINSQDSEHRIYLMRSADGQWRVASLEQSQRDSLDALAEGCAANPADVKAAWQQKAQEICQ